jgi:hypothetical protein
LFCNSTDDAAMGVRTRGLDIATAAKRQVADAAVRSEAQAVIGRWNEQLARSRDMLWSPTIRAALIAGTPWLGAHAKDSRFARLTACGSKSRGDEPVSQDAHPRDKARRMAVSIAIEPGQPSDGALP